MQTSEPDESMDHKEEAWSSLHPAMLLFELGGVLRSTLFPLILGGTVMRESSFFLTFLFGLMFLSIIGMLFRYFGYRYSYGAGQIRIRQGIFSKKVRTISVNRIHNINVHQGIIARMLGVVRLDIETAGGDQAEASMAALSRSKARNIQDFVRREKAQSAEHRQETDDTRDIVPIYRMTLSDILIAGATTSRMGMIMVGLAAVFNYVQESTFMGRPDWVQDLIDLASSISIPGGFTMVVIGLMTLVLVFLLAWLISIASALVRWYRFTLVQKGVDLNIRTGLLTIREFTIPLNKVQALQFDITPLRRPLGLLQIRVISAGHVGIEENRRAESDILAPITHNRQVDHFVRSVYKDANWDGVKWRAVDLYTRNRHFRILCSTLLLPAIGLSIPFEAWRPVIWGVYLCLGIPGAWFVAHQTYRHTAYAYDADYIYIKNGFIGLHYWVLPTRRLQNLAVHQNPFQRRLGLASLVLDLAGADSSPVIPNIDVRTAWLLFNRFGHPRPMKQHQPAVMIEPEEDPAIVPELAS